MTDYAFDNWTSSQTLLLADYPTYKIHCMLFFSPLWLVGLSVQEMGRDALVEHLTASTGMFETS